LAKYSWVSDARESVKTMLAAERAKAALMYPTMAVTLRAMESIVLHSVKI